ncbi:unnamed protein product [Polarella glacialis]|uniref:RING-type domain-containing protein n=1 Tax=Polarella glacialis TaxID=89957 RepID=A0A813JJ61_POLGL|nr:unnamed protein product [Polarella glacialis]
MLWPSLLSRQTRENLWLNLAEQGLGGQRAVLFLYRAQVAEALTGICLLPGNILLFFLLEDNALFTLRSATEILVLALVPVLMGPIRIVLALRQERACREIAVSGGVQGDYVAAAQQLVDLSSSPTGRRLNLVSAMMLSWLAGIMLWGVTMPPCDQFSEVLFWEIEKNEVSCEALGLTTSMLFAAGMLTFGFGLAVHTGLNFLIERARPRPAGLTEELLALLPSHKYGVTPSGSTLPALSRGADATEAEDADDHVCSVCLENFSHGEVVRELPCRHTFHIGCIDDWLKRTPSCPMRCEPDLRTWSTAAGLSLRGQPRREADADAVSSDAESTDGNGRPKAPGQNDQATSPGEASGSSSPRPVMLGSASDHLT